MELDADLQRLPEEMALHEQGTLFEVTLAILSAASDVDDLMRSVARIIAARHRFEHFAIYLAQSGDFDLRLASVESADDFSQEASMTMAKRAAAGPRSVSEHDGRLWRVAVPIEADSAVLGVIVAGSATSSTRASRALVLCKALAAQLALGVQNTDLRRQQLEVVADQERARIAHEIHDGVAQSMYALNLGLENCARLAQREDFSRLSESLSRLVPLSRQTLLEIRHYMYDLTPLLSAEDSFEDLVKKQAGEFEAISQIPAHVKVRGGNQPIPVPVRAGIYRILHEALSNVLQHSAASEVRIKLDVGCGNVRMSVNDNGVGFNMEEAKAGIGLDGMRRRAEEMGGTSSITSTEGAGTDIRVSVPLEPGSWNYKRQRHQDGEPESDPKGYQ